MLLVLWPVLKLLIQILLSPFSLLYGIITFMRNLLYDQGIFKSTSFNSPKTIIVGNLSLGGTGKTPHIEYLIELLQGSFSIATLSRGYKRKTKGFIIASDKSSSSDIGDEPLQFFKKFKSIIVSVCEDRVYGILQLINKYPKTNIVLLDDAFQHRAIKAGLNILITEYNNLYVDDYVIPSGRLREWKSGSKRADIIIVSKTPQTISKNEQISIKNKLSPLSHQSVFFTKIIYGELLPFTSSAKKTVNLSQKFSILAFAGIANPKPFSDKLKTQFASVTTIKFGDHHDYTINDIKKIQDSFDKINNENKIIITTEKDIMRLSLTEIFNEVQDIPIFYIPIEVKFHGDSSEEFNKKVIDYVGTN